MGWIAYGQTPLIVNGDTNVCFTLPKTRELLSAKLKTRELTQLNSNCEQRVTAQQKIIYNDSLATNYLNAIIKDKSSEIQLKDFEITNAKNETKKALKEVRKQKVYKWVAIICGGAATGFMTWQYLKK